MSEPFLGEVKLIAFNFAPQGWALCNGQLLPINQNQALFSLLGTMYGGDGRTTFALPDLRGRVPIHLGNGHTQGERGGTDAHTLSINELPAHTHTLQASANDATANLGTNAVLAKSTTRVYHAAGALVAGHASMTTTVGGSQPHENRQPFLVLNFVIALQGIFPSRN